MSYIPLDVEEGVFYTGTHMDDWDIMRNIHRGSDTKARLRDLRFRILEEWY